MLHAVFHHRLCLLRLPLICVCSFLLVAGCTTPRSPQQTVWELSPDAQTSYAALLLDHSIRSEYTSGVLEAADIFLQVAPLSSPLCEAAAWLLIIKEPQLARDLLQKALVKLPEDLPLHLMLAEAWLDENRPDAAIEVLKAFIKKRPDSDAARQELGILFLKANLFEQAASTFAALPKHLRSSYVRYCHARALIMLKRPEEAAVELEHAVSTSPAFVEGWSEYARALEMSGQFAKARTAYKKLIAFDPDNAEVWVRLIALEVQAGRIAEASKLARSNAFGVGFTLSVASVFLEHQRYAEARSLLEDAQNMPDVPAEIWLYLAMIAFEKDTDLQQSMALLDRISNDDPLADRAMRFRVQMQYAAGDFDAALQTLQEALTLFPSDRDFLLMQAQIYMTQESWMLSRRAFEQALSVYPDDTDILFYYGSVLDILNRKDEAIAVMERILTLDNAHYQAMNYIGYCLADNPERYPADGTAETLTKPEIVEQNLAKALALLNRAIALAPDKAYIIDSLAWAQYRSGNFVGAWNNIRHAVTLPEGNEADIWDHYGDIANALGHIAEARKGWGKALSFSPVNALLIQRKLDSLSQ